MLRFPALLALAVIFLPSSAQALYEGLQCVPYARALTGVEIRGDAHTWWDQAKGRYDRGSLPKVGAIMSFRPHGAMQLGHVAAVRHIVDSRTVIISHANWSTIDGQRGHVEENVKVVDASENNDWSRVRVWYTPNQAMGGTAWPLNGFIYPKAPLSHGQMKSRLVALLGERARFTPLPAGSARGEVRMASAVVKPKASPARPQPSPAKMAAGFSLPSSAFAAAKPTTKPTTTKSQKDDIGDLIASLGN